MTCLTTWQRVWCRAGEDDTRIATDNPMQSHRIGLLFFFALVSCVAAFTSPACSSGVRLHRKMRCGRIRVSAEDEDNDDEEPQRDLGDELNAFLSRPIIDPDRPGDENEPQMLRDFKRLATEDYQLAEALYAGLVFSILLWFAQQGVRVYKHCYFMPDSLCPFGDATPLLDFNF